MPRMKNTNEDKEILFFSQIRKGQEIQIRSRAKVWRSMTQHAVLGGPQSPLDNAHWGDTVTLPSPWGGGTPGMGAREQDIVGGLVRMGSGRLFRGSAGFPQISLTPFPREPEGVTCLVGDCLLSFKQIVLMQEPSPAWRLASFDLPLPEQQRAALRGKSRLRPPAVCGWDPSGLAPPQGALHRPAAGHMAALPGTSG